MRNFGRMISRYMIFIEKFRAKIIIFDKKRIEKELGKI